MAATPATAGFSPALRLLLTCAQPPPLPVSGQDIRGLCRAVTDWRRFLVLATQHRTGPLLDRNLAGLEAPGVPRAVREALAEQTRRNTRRSLLQIGELARLAPLFETADIPFLLLKGPGLALQAYADPTLRHAGDLDLLVTPATRKAAQAVLESAGYRRTWPAGRLSPGREALLLRYAAETPFRHHGHGLEVELHWRWTHNEYLFPLDFEIARQRAERLALGGASIPVPAATDHLLYAAVHGAKHGWARVQWLADLPALVARRIDIAPNDAYARADELGIAPLLTQGLSLARSALRTRLPQRFDRRIEAQPPLPDTLTRLPLRGLDQGPVFWSSAAPLNIKISRLRYLLGLHPKSAYKQRTLACYATSFDDLQRLSIPDTLLPLYPLLRPFSWLAQRGHQQAERR